MPTTLNREALNKLYVEDLEWLLQQPRTLERDHIECAIKWFMNGAGDAESSERIAQLTEQPDKLACHTGRTVPDEILNAEKKVREKR